MNQLLRKKISLAILFLVVLSGVVLAEDGKEECKNCATWAKQLKDAMYKKGFIFATTDEEAIYKVLEGRTAEEIKGIKSAYIDLTGKPLEYDLKDDLSGWELNRALSAIDPNKIPKTDIEKKGREDAIKLVEAMDTGAILGSTDEDAVFNALQGKTKEEMDELKKQFNYVVSNKAEGEDGERLTDWIKGDFSDAWGHKESAILRAIEKYEPLVRVSTDLGDLWFTVQKDGTWFKTTREIGGRVYAIDENGKLKYYDKNKKKWIDADQDSEFNKRMASELSKYGEKVKKEEQKIEAEQKKKEETALISSATEYYKKEENKKYLDEFASILEQLGDYDKKEIEKIKKGDIAAIKKAQEWLVKNGFNVGSTGADGKVGKNTLDAAKAALKKKTGIEESVTEKPIVLGTQNEVNKLLYDCNLNEIEKWFKDEKSIKDNEDKIRYLATLLGVEKGKLTLEKFAAEVKKKFDERDFKDPRLIKVDGVDVYFWKGKKGIIHPAGLIFGSKVYDKEGKELGDYLKDYNIYIPTGKETGYYYIGNKGIEVNVEKKGKTTYYTIKDPSILGIGDVKAGESVYLLKNNNFYYKDSDGDDIYSNSNFVKNNKLIKSLTPIETFYGGYRYTEKIDKKNSEIVIGNTETKTEDRFKSTSGLLPIGIEYFEDKDGNVYIWNDVLKKYVNSKGIPVDKEDAKTDKINKDFAWFGLELDKWTYLSSGYRGMSFFYEEPNWWLGYDETIMNYLGGIDGWTSEICKGRIVDSHEYGVAAPSVEGGASAHIEGEKVKVIDYSTADKQVYFLYKISLEVNPGSEYSGCDMKFKVFIKDPKRSIFKDSETGSQYTFEVEKGNESVSYKGSSMILKKSRTEYEEVCIYFKELKGPCSAGLEEGEELCSKVVDGGEKSLSLGEDPCDDWPTNVMVNCWGGDGLDSKDEDEEDEKSEGIIGDW